MNCVKKVVISIIINRLFKQSRPLTKVSKLGIKS